MTRLLPLALLAALLLAGLAAAGGHADNKKPPAPPPKQTPEQKKALELAKREAEQKKRLANAEMNGKLGEVIKEAYVLLAAANADYRGHRAKAMYHVRCGAKILDDEVVKGAFGGGCLGSAAQKLKILQEDMAVNRAAALAKYGVTIKEDQAVSDAVVLRAGVMLKELVPVLIQTKHPGVLACVKNALKEIDLALATR